MKWLISALATTLVAAGCLLAYPGVTGEYLAGLALIIAGVQCALVLFDRKGNSNR